MTVLRRLSIRTIWVALILGAAGSLSPARSQMPVPETISVIRSDTSDPVTELGFDRLRQALEEKGIDMDEVEGLGTATGTVRIVVRNASRQPVKKGASSADLPPMVADSIETDFAHRSESFVLVPTGAEAPASITLIGSDDRGVLYGLLHLAERIRWSPSDTPFAEVDYARRTPDVADRSIVKVVTNKSQFERYFYDEEYWDQYLDRLAESRFNNFQLLFGYRALGYFEPVYPFLFDVEGYDDVRVVGLSSEKQRRNREMLRRIIEMTHAHGLEFTLGLWTHIYRVEEPVEGVPYGLTDQNLIPYSKAGLERLLQEYPGVDAIQFRVHTESALNLPQQRAFWREMLEVIHRVQPDLRVDMRAKGFTDDMIAAALSTGVPFRMVTKYWGEQMGLPYHPTHLKGKEQYKRRHGYANLLRYPKRYDMQWRLWNHGTTRLLLWGSPDYVRRFARSSHLYEGDGYEVYEPLSTKMWKHREEQTFDIHQAPYRYYEWEFQRYWHFYDVFGRVGYDYDTESRVWDESFEEHYGPKAGPYLKRALHLASGVLPRINAYLMPELSASRSWAGFQRWQDLDEYIQREPSDPAQFLSIRGAAKRIVQGVSSPRIWPQETSQWFRERADSIEQLVQSAEHVTGPEPGAEFQTTVVDLKMLAHIAQYHAERIRAGLHLALYEETGSLSAFDTALRYEKRAIASWEGLVADVEGVYADSLIFGSNTGWGYLTGHWSDELRRLKQGFRELEERRSSARPKVEESVAKFDFGNGATAPDYYRIERNTLYPRETLEARSLGVGMSDGKPLYGTRQASYGWWHEYTADYPEWHGGSDIAVEDRDFVRGPDPFAFWRAYNHSAFTADMPNGSYRLAFSLANYSADTQTYGPMWIIANGRERTERFSVPHGERVEKSLESAVVSNQLNVTFKTVSTSQWLVNSLRVTEIDPVIDHVPVRRLGPEEPLQVEATIAGIDSIQSASLRYQTGNKRPQSVPMRSTGAYKYQAIVQRTPAEGGLSYWIEAVDEGDRREVYPPAGAENPIRVTVTADSLPPVVQHDPVESADSGTPITIWARVADPSGVQYVRLKYRDVNQHQDYRSIRMRPTGTGSMYQATIPAAHVGGPWDLMYYIETMDRHGNGTIFPSLRDRMPYVVVSLER